MPNSPVNFPYLVGSVPEQNQELTGGPDQFPGPGNLPLPINSTTRYWPLYDNTTAQIRMWKSINNGKTWTQFDSINSPVLVPDNSGGGTIQIYEYFNACYSSFDSRIYVVTFNASFNLTLVPFNTLTDSWEAQIDSSITYTPTPNTYPRGLGGFMIAARPTDGAVWIGFMGGNSGTATVGSITYTDFGTMYAAKCAPGGAGWDGSATRLGGTAFDGLLYATGAMACDEITGDIHCIYTRQINGLGSLLTITSAGSVITSYSITGGAGYPVPSFSHSINTYTTTTGADPAQGGPVVDWILNGSNPVGQPGIDGTVTIEITGRLGKSSVVHRVIKADDSFGSEDTPYEDSVGGFLNVSNLKVGDGVMSFCMSTGAVIFALGQVMRVGRAVIADTPTWDITAPSAPNTTPDVNAQMMETVRVGGIDYLFYAYNSGSTAFYSYITSAGIGFAWSAEINFASADNSGATFYGTLILSPQLSAGWAIGMFAGDDWGMGYWEPSSSPTRRIGFIPCYTKRRSAPGN